MTSRSETRILVIDDDISVGLAIRELVSSEGRHVFYVNSGRLGIQALANSSFDLAMVDIFMPGMDGIETIRHCRRLAPKMRLIVMSGFRYRTSWGTMPDYLAMAGRLGAAAVLRKPFQPQELSAAVFACLAQGVTEDESRISMISSH